MSSDIHGRFNDYIPPLIDPIALAAAISEQEPTMTLEGISDVLNTPATKETT